MLNKILSLGLLGMYSLLLTNNQTEKMYKIINKTPYPISNIRLFEKNINKELPPNSYITGYGAFGTLENSVLMFRAKRLNFGVYITSPEEGKPYVYSIDSLNPETRDVFVSHPFAHQ